jgi:hypothetical protein
MVAGRFAWSFLVLMAGCARSADTPPAGPVPTTAAAPTAAPAGVPEVDPRGGIGPVRLGQTREQLDGLGMAVKADGANLALGPYTAGLGQGKVDFVEVQLAGLPAGLRVGGTVIAPTEKDITRIARLLPDCGKLEALEGGNMITCAGGLVHVKAGGPPGIVAIDVMAPSRMRRP